MSKMIDQITRRRTFRPHYRRQAGDCVIVESPREIELLIQAHCSVYPENDPRREWLARALRRWAGEE